MAHKNLVKNYLVYMAEYTVFVYIAQRVMIKVSQNGLVPLEIEAIKLCSAGFKEKSSLPAPG